MTKVRLEPAIFFLACAILLFACANAFAARQETYSISGYIGTKKISDYTGQTPAAAQAACETALDANATVGKRQCKTPVLTWIVTPDPPSTATLTWSAVTQNTNGTPYTDPFGYVINYGNAPDQLTQSVDVNDPNATTYTIQGLTAGPWYFCVRARNTSNARSDCSNVVSKTL